MAFPYLSAIWRTVKGAGQLAQLSSGSFPLFRLLTLANLLGVAATYVVLGRPRKALVCLRGAAK